jgi:hypothetical protein
MQSSLPVEPTDRNIKAVDIADSAEIAKIVAIRVGGPISGACAGWSRVASARLAGMGVMFSMTGTIGARPAVATHRNVTFLMPPAQRQLQRTNQKPLATSPTLGSPPVSPGFGGPMGGPKGIDIRR